MPGPWREPTGLTSSGDAADWKAMLMTNPLWPCSVAVHSPVKYRQSLTVESWLAVAIVPSSDPDGWKTTEMTARSWPGDG